MTPIQGIRSDLQEAEFAVFRRVAPSGMTACVGPFGEWPGSPVTVWRKIYVSRSEMAQGGTDGPYDPAWSGPEGTVPGAFDDGFIEMQRLGEETGEVYVKSLAAYCMFWPGNLVWYAHNYTTFGHWIHTAHLLGVDAIGQREDVGANPEEKKILGASCERHAFNAVGDIFRSLCLPSSSGCAENRLTLHGYRFGSHHELGHVIGGFSEASGECPWLTEPKNATVMNFHCIWDEPVEFYSLSELRRLRQSPALE